MSSELSSRWCGCHNAQSCFVSPGEGFNARGAITHPKNRPASRLSSFQLLSLVHEVSDCLSTPHPATADEIHTRLRGAHSHNATAVYNNSTCPAVHIRGSAVLLNAACRSVKCLIASLKFQRSNPIKDDVHVTDISDSAKGCMHVQW
jgi:hypothetical protein